MMGRERSNAMAKRAKKKRRASVPPMGPPRNLRPAGVHEEKGRKTRADQKRAALVLEEPDYSESA
jgi:hypothetical protein